MTQSSDLHPYRPSPRFLEQLKARGVDWDHPERLEEVPNQEADALFPITREKSKRRRWISALWWSVLPGAAFGTPVDGLMTGASVLGAILLAMVLNLMIGSLGALMHYWQWRGGWMALRSVAPRPPVSSGPMKTLEALPEKAVESESEPNPTPLWMLGGASRKGLVREENQDAYRVALTNSGQGVLVVCDGVGGHPGGGEAARFAVGHLVPWLREEVEAKGASPQLIRLGLDVVQRAFVDEKVVGLTTAIVVLFDRNTAHYGVLGDGELVVIHPDGITQSLLAPHHAPGGPSQVITAYLSAAEVFNPRLGSVVLQPESLVLAMSDGAADLLPLDQVAEQRKAYLLSSVERGMDQICMQMLRSLEQARDEDTDALLHSDNMTLAMAVLREEAQS